jgi:hypothetical protein
MSHFTTIRTKFVDVKTLVKALAMVGFVNVEVHAEAQNLYGYKGDKRPQTAEVIIRRRYVGKISNDIGFKRISDGSFDTIISDYDRQKYDAKWLGKLCQHYACIVAKEKLISQGFAIVEENFGKDKAIHITMRRIA